MWGGGPSKFYTTKDFAASRVGSITPCTLVGGGIPAFSVSSISGSVGSVRHTLAVCPSAWCTVDLCVFLLRRKTALVSFAAGLVSGRVSRRRMAASALASILELADGEQVLC